MPSYLNHHFFDPVTRFVGDARDVGGTCGVYFARTCCKIRHFTGPAEIELHPCLNHHFFEHPISREKVNYHDDIYGPEVHEVGPHVVSCMLYIQVIVKA